MTKKILTAAAVEKLKPKTGKSRNIIPDGLYPGLCLQIQPSGKKSWALWYRLHGKQHKYTIGSYPPIGLGDARDLAKDALKTVGEGRDPAAEKKEALKANADASAQAITVEDACGRFVRLYCRPKLRSWRDTARRLGLKPDPKDETKFERTGNGIVSAWGDRQIRNITRGDVQDRIDAIAADYPIAANLELAILRKFFGWCEGREMIRENPCAKIGQPSKSVSRDRVLSDEELKVVWLAAEKLKYPFGRMIQELILTGQRRDEVAQMRWPEIDEKAKTWTIPDARRKNAQTQIVPLSDAALEIIRKLPRIKSDKGFVFTTTGKSPISGYSKWKQKLDNLIRESDSEIAPWRLHDLRRTMATGLQRLGVRLEVTESCLGHSSGSRSGIVGIYQRHDWATEKRAALDAWAQHVLALVSGADEQSKVVQLRDKRA